MNKLLIFLLLLTNCTFGQKSNLYRDDKRLIADTIFQIDDNSFHNLINLEKVLLPRMYNQIKFPEIARENNQEGRVIVLLFIDSKTKNPSFSIVKSDNDFFKTAVTDHFSHIIKDDFLLQQIKPEQGDLKVYIPIDFKLLKDRFQETLRQNKTITIETIDIAKQTIIIKH